MKRKTATHRKQLRGIKDKQTHKRKYMPELFGSDSMSEAHEDITAFTIIPSPDLECKLGVDLRAIYE